MGTLWRASGETFKLRDQLNSPPNEKDSWIKCSDLPVCETTVRNGPKWGPGVFVDVIVRLTDKEGRHHLLRIAFRLLLESISCLLSLASRL